LFACTPYLNNSTAVFPTIDTNAKSLVLDCLYAIGRKFYA